MNKILITLFIITLILTTTPLVFADETTVINNALNYLKTKQDSTGKITGFGGESEWAAIAFAANNIDIPSVKNPTVSLKDFLLVDQPSSTAQATYWERKILAIVAIGDDPTNFNGVNYLKKLEGFANNNQIGSTSLLNDDIFGLLALIACGTNSNLQIKQDTLDFIISHQNTDGGFSYSTISPTNTSDSNDTAAALQALKAASDHGLTNPNLDTALTNGKNYLLSTQKNDGGFGYDSASDADGSSTSWALIALNTLGISNSIQATQAKNWLTSNQNSDGGFQYLSGYGSDTYTSSHALLGITGKSWLLHIFTQTATPSATPTPIATSSATPISIPTPSPTPVPIINIINNYTLYTATPSPSPTSTPTSTPIVSPLPETSLLPEVLGESIVEKREPSPTSKPNIQADFSLINSFKTNTLPIAGVFSLFVTLNLLERRWKR